MHSESLALRIGGNHVRLARNYESKWCQTITMLFDEAEKLVERLQQICHVNPFLAVEFMDRVDGLPLDWVRTTARRIQHEVDRLMSELSQMEKHVEKQRGSSGTWDDIEDSIGDEKTEVRDIGALALSRLGVGKEISSI